MKRSVVLTKMFSGGRSQSATVIGTVIAFLENNRIKVDVPESADRNYWARLISKLSSNKYHELIELIEGLV